MRYRWVIVAFAPGSIMAIFMDVSIVPYFEDLIECLQAAARKSDLLTFWEGAYTIERDKSRSCLGTGGSFMAVVQPDFYRHNGFVRKSIQIPSTQHKELKALAAELESSLGDVVETI